MNNLQVTAHLATALSVTDDWSPSLEALLEYLWLDDKGLALPNPSAENLFKAELPLRMDNLKGQDFWACSSPFYLKEAQQIDKYRKRWDYQDKHLDWGKKKQKVNTSEGVTKSYDMPLKLINTSRLDWFLVGDRNKVERLLSSCTAIGKKRSYGKGQVYRWEVKEVEHDWSLTRNDRLTRAIPIDLVHDKLDLTGYNFLRWGWKNPSWLPESIALCVMPVN